MNIETLTTFLAYTSAIHLFFLCLSFFLMLIAKDFLFDIYARMFDVPRMEVAPLFLTMLGNYKILASVTSFVPYVALKLMF